MKVVLYLNVCCGILLWIRWKGRYLPLKETKESQPYDSLLKMLFGDKAREIIPNLLPGTEMLGDPRDEEHNIEIDRSTLRADLVFRIFFLGVLGLLNLELET